MDNSPYSNNSLSLPQDRSLSFHYLNDFELGLRPLSQEIRVCEICYEEKTLLILPNCYHSFCESCICSYLIIKISESDVLNMKCPNCPTEIDQSTIQELLDDENFEKFLKFSEIKRLEQDVMVRWCPIPDCGGYDKAYVSHHNLICNKCEHKYCYVCSKPWHKGACKINTDLGLQIFKLTNNVRSCPNCKNYVQKNGGCLHMYCPRCNHKWCWMCGGDYSSPNHSEITCLTGSNIFDLYISFIFLMIIFPVLIPFLFLFSVIYMYETESIERDSFKSIFFCFRSRLIAYPLAFVLSPFLEILVVVFGYFILVVMFFTFNLPYWKYLDLFCRLIVAILIPSLIYTVGAILISLITVLVPCLGLICLMFKIVYTIRKYCKSEGEAEYSRMI